MTKNGRAVKTYLVDGTSNGVLITDMMTWTGIITIVPRSSLVSLSRRKEVKRGGIYFLIGENPNDPLEELVYIGESNNVLERLSVHNREPKKGFWQRTVIVTSKDENLTKAHILYLEKRLIQIALDAQRVKLLNNTNSNSTSLPEADIMEMESFVSQVKMLLPVFGYSFLSTLHSSGQQRHDGVFNAESPIFIMVYGGIEASAQEQGSEFFVLKGSRVRKQNTKSLTETYIQMRSHLLKEGKLEDSEDEKYWIVTQNIPFTSVSAAANVIAGSLLNGRIVWKEKESKKTYNEWQEALIDL